MKKGWPVTRLGDLTDLVTKGTTPTSIGHEFVEEGINFVKVESITTTGQFIEEKFAHITPACHAVLGRSQLQAGDILFSIAGALGRTGFVTDDILPANTNQALAIIRLKRDVGLSPKFVLKALETGVVLEQIEKFKGGVAQQNLSLAQVRDFQIALPPLAEQQRIVGLLDEAFEGLATAKANAEKNLQNARALFESHLQSVFTQRGPGWQTKTLEEACQFSNGLWKGEKPPFVKVGVIRNTNFTKEGTLDDSDIAYLDVEAKKLEKRRLQFGDIILEKSGGGPKQPVGRVALFDKEEGDFSFSNFTAALRVLDPDDLDFRFVHKFLHWTYLSGVTKGMQSNSTGIRNLDGDAYKAIEISFPPLAEQQRIVDLLASLHEETQRLARLYERKHAALEALKKSLLHQAFTGEL